MREREREREGISKTHDEDSSAVSPNSPSTVRVSPSPPFLAEDSLFTSGDIGGASGDSPELDSDPLWKDRHTHISRNIHMYMYMCIFLELRTCTCTIVAMCEDTLEIKSWGLLIHKFERTITQRSKSRLVEMAGSVGICKILLLYHQNNNETIANLSVSYNSNRHLKCSTKLHV